MTAYASSANPFTPSDFGITVPGGTQFPEISFSNGDSLGKSFTFGPNPSFGNAGMFQNQWQYGSTLRWVKGRHSLSFGLNWNYTQLNIVNNNTNSDIINFSSFTNFLEGSVRTGTHSTAFLGTASRYYRSNTGGAFVNDNYKIASNLTVTLGLRWDLDGGLSEKYGRLTGFDSKLYSYNAGTDTITGSGLEVAGNNATMGTSGASNTLLNNPQWGFAPRLGIAWSPTSKLTVRTGFGIYYDRGELFTYLNAGAGGGFSGPSASPSPRPSSPKSRRPLARHLPIRSPRPAPPSPAARPSSWLSSRICMTPPTPSTPPGISTDPSSSAATTLTTSCRTAKTGASTCSIS